MRNERWTIDELASVLGECEPGVKVRTIGAEATRYAVALLRSQSAELKAKDETIRGIEGNLFECRERIAELENYSRSGDNIIDAYEKSMTAIREAIGLSEFDDHELVIDEIKLKQLLLAEQASRLGAFRDASKRALALVANWQTHCDYRAEPYLQEACKLLAAALLEPGVGQRLPATVCPKCDGPAYLDPVEDLVCENGCKQPDAFMVRAVERQIPTPDTCSHNWKHYPRAAMFGGGYYCSGCGGQVPAPVSE